MLSMHSIILVTIFTIGTSLNFIALFYSCRKNNNQELDSFKYLIVAQALYSITAIASSFGFVFVEFLPQSFCTLLPTAFVISTSFAVFNLAALAVVKHAQLTSAWNLRFSSALLIIVEGLVVSTALEFPVLYYAAKRTPIVVYNCPGYPNSTAMEHLSLSEMQINAVSHASFIIVLHLAIPCIIILNRLTLIQIFVWTEIDEQKPRESYKTAQRWINTLSGVLVVFIFLSPIYLEITQQECIFHVFAILTTAILCLPVYLWDETFKGDKMQVDNR